MMYPIALSQAVDLNQAGGKAANLARAIQQGFLVPEGFVLSNAALRLFLETNRFLATVQMAQEAYNDLDWHERIKRFEALRDTTLQLPVPRAVKEAVEPVALDLLRHSPAGIAVRSSGVCEDLEKASFAGIYESFLGVADLETFWQSILRCWCSTWSPQATVYAQKMGIVLPLDGMAVLVQTMVPAECSGVIFTADPATGNPWRFLLNVTLGLGQKLVDCSAPADRFVLTWDTAEILEKRIERKPSKLVFDGRKMGEVFLPESQQQIAALSDEQARALAQMALTIDRVFDRRMDIEWAIAGDQIYLLQARPLTVLPPFFPHSLSEEDAAETWTPYLNQHGTMNEQERLIAPFHRHRWLLELWSCYLTENDVFPHRYGKERDFNGYRYTIEWKWGGRAPDWPRIEGWLDAHEPRLRRDWLDQLERVRQTNTVLDTQMAAALNSPTTRAEDWVRLALAYEREEYQMQAAVWYASQWLIFTCEELLQRFMNEVMHHAGIANLPAGLLQGLFCFSVERTIAAQALGRRINEDFARAAFTDQPLGQVLPFLIQNYPDCVFLQDFSSFCSTFGMHLPTMGGQKNAQDQDLEGVLLMIKTRMQGQGADAKTILFESAVRRQAIEAQVRDWLQQHRPDQLDRFNKLLDWSQFWTPALDNRKWHLAMSVRLGKLYQHTQAALVAEGLVDHPDHFFLLTPQEWAGYVEHPDPTMLRLVYQERQHEYEHNRRLEPLPFLGQPPISQAVKPDQGQAGQTRVEAEPGEAKLFFQGEGIAPGKVRGIAYKIDLSRPNTSDAMDQLTTDHILICGRDEFNAQWKRDWSSLFMIVRGLVTVQGAQLHHATQIARECGTPFINLPEAVLANIPNGAWIEMDGQTGTLIVL